MKIFDVTLNPNNANLICYIQDKSPEMATADVRPAMLVFPGGGYFNCSDREAEPVALAYLSEGYNAFVLRYSVGADVPWERSYEDGIAAVKYVREHAESLDIDPQKIAVVGFSAGGHLAACMGTISDEKPNALVLGYPVILDEFGVAIGKSIASADKFVTQQTPPSFLFATSNDSLVPIRNSLTFAQALAAEDIFFEMHIYPMGEHGFSLGKAAHANGNPGVVNKDAENWFRDSIRFLHHVFGDFPLNDKAQPGDLPDYSHPDLDTPVRYLIKRPACVKAIDSVIPGVSEMLKSNTMAQGLSFRQLAVYSPNIFTAELLSTLACVLKEYKGSQRHNL